MDESAEGTIKERSDIARLLSDIRYLVLATSDLEGRPWVTPVFFASLDEDRLCWVSSPDSRHSRNIAERPAVALTAFDSTVPVGHAEATYFEGEASRLPDDEADAALLALNARLPQEKRMELQDLLPRGLLAPYAVRLRRRYVLVRGGDPVHGNQLDITVEV